MRKLWERLYGAINENLKDVYPDPNYPPTQKQLEEFFDNEFPKFKNTLSGKGESLTEEDLTTAKQMAIQNNRISQDSETTLDKVKKREDWIPFDKEWNAWKAYKIFLEKDKGWGWQPVERLNKLSSNILNRLGNPEDNIFDYKGLAVGDIQSGKTTAYCAVICKAYDMGYRNFLVLSGMAEDLRIQCQTRIEESIIGLDSRDYLEISSEEESNIRDFEVRNYQNPKLQHIDWSTTSKKRGDFTKAKLKTSYIKLPANSEMFKVMVVKKNKTILNNVLKYLMNNDEQMEVRDGRKFLKNRPFLIIDDEADLASINTKEFQDEDGNFDPNLEPSAINKVIRDIIGSINQSSYLGFTATPYANVFINATETPGSESDIFPEDFIINVKPPSNYFGATKLFGFESTEPLPLLRKIDISEQENWMPARHKKDFIPLISKLPKDLKDSIKSFILGIAIKEFRGREDHTSMLIHTSRFIDVHNRIHDQVKDEIDQLNYRVKHNDIETIEELKKIYDDDFVKTGKKFIELYKNNENIDIAKIEDYKTPEWSEVKNKLVKILQRLSDETSIVVLNSKTNQIIDFNLPDFNQPGKYLYRIFIGGQRLSRGLTIEGLTTCYFTRVANTPLYDSLMQMARWFGYRTGYLDLCRIYSSEKIFTLFESITKAAEDMKTQFDDMAKDRKTPREYSIAVQNSPGLNITSRSKMRTAITLNYDTQPWSTCQYYLTDDESMKKDISALEGLIKTMNEQSDYPDQKNFTWEKIKKETVIDFFDSLSNRQAQTNPEQSSRWIANQNPDYMTEWTVILKTGKSPKTYLFNGLNEKIKLVKRGNIRDKNKKGILYTSVTSGGDYKTDLNSSEQKKFKDYMTNLPDRYGPYAAMKSRPTSRGLLIIYPIFFEEEGKDLPLIGWAFGRPEFESKSINVNVNSTIPNPEQLAFEEMEEIND